MKLIYARREQEKAAFCRGGGGSRAPPQLTGGSQAACRSRGRGAGGVAGQRGGAGSEAGRGERLSALGPRGGSGSGAGHGEGGYGGHGKGREGRRQEAAPVIRPSKLSGNAAAATMTPANGLSHLPAEVSGEGEDKQMVVPSPPSELGEMHRCAIP